MIASRYEHSNNFKIRERVNIQTTSKFEKEKIPTTSSGDATAAAAPSQRTDAAVRSLREEVRVAVVVATHEAVGALGVARARALVDRARALLRATRRVVLPGAHVVLGTGDYANGTATP